MSTPNTNEFFDYTVNQYLQQSLLLSDYCQALFQNTKITYVGYLRMTRQYEFTPLFSHQGYFSDFLANRLYASMYSHIPFEGFQSGYYDPRGLYESSHQLGYLTEMADRYHLCSRFLVVRKEPLFCEKVMFAFADHSVHHLNFCINNISLLDHFIDALLPMVHQWTADLPPLPLEFTPVQHKDGAKGFLMAHQQSFLGRPLPLSLPNIQLTAREKSVLYLLMQGNTPKQIAHKLDLALRTVQNNLEAIKTKFECSSVTQLLSFFIDKKYLSKLSF